MNVTIVIPVYNTGKTIAKVVNACLNQKAPENRIEIIVVDDGSTDSTADIIKQFPVRYIYQANSGPAKARNTGWKAANGELVCFTDSDCIPREDWISNLIEGFIEDDIGAVAGSYNIANPESFLSSCIHEEIKLRHMRFKKYIRAFGSYNVAIRRHVLKEVGGFNEDYSAASGEDNDLSYKIIRAGYKIKFQEKALVAHNHTEQLWKYLKEQYRHGYWRMKMYKDFPDMTKGDDYTAFKDVFEIPLALMTFCSVIFLWHRYGFIVFLALTVSNSIMQLSTIIKLIKIKKSFKFKFIYLALVTFLRAYVRAFGAIKGIWKFWL